MTNLNVSYAINKMTAAMKSAAASLNYTENGVSDTEVSILMAEVAGKHIESISDDVNDEQRHNLHRAASDTHAMIAHSLMS